MLFNYETLTKQLNDHLIKKYPGITTSFTDIFEHALLHFLGYRFVPEKCQFEDDSEHKNLIIYLKTPYELTKSKFVNDLQICIANEFANIKLKEINPSLQRGFCVRLSVAYTWLKDNMSEIFESINKILADPLKINFYQYLDSYAKEFREDLTIAYINHLINKKLLAYPYLSIDNVWSAIIQEHMAKNVKITFLGKQVAIDIDNFPKIILTYQEKHKISTIAITRNQLVTILSEKNSFENFLEDYAVFHEIIPPNGIISFIEKNYHRSFSINEAGHYIIELGYHENERKILEKFGIKELKSFQANESAERARFYVYDKKNYLKLLTVFKEIKGEACFDTRWHQLIYYVKYQMWDKLTKELKFLLNLNAETGIKIDYTKLLMRLYLHAKDNLQAEVKEHTFKIIKEVCEWITEKLQLSSDVSKEIYTILYELTLLLMNQLKEDAIKCVFWKEKLFTFSQKAGLKESNHYLAEIAGLKLGNTFVANVNTNPLAVLIELAKKNKEISEENIHLKMEITILKAKNSLPESPNSVQTNNTASYFTLRK